jgi:hypothetical protein
VAIPARSFGGCQDHKALPHREVARVDDCDVSFRHHLPSRDRGVVGGTDQATDAEANDRVSPCFEGRLVGYGELTGCGRRGGGQFAFAVYAGKKLRVVDIQTGFKGLLSEMNRDGHLLNAVISGNLGWQTGVGVGKDCYGWHWSLLLAG